MLDLEWLLGVNGTLVRQLLELYRERFGVLLPTVGTVWDVGSKLTHKAIVVEMALQGLSTQQITGRLYRTLEAVDQCLRTFDRVLMLKYYRVPSKVMCRVTGHSSRVIEEHLALAQKHFATDEELTGCLANRGVELEVAS